MKVRYKRSGTEAHGSKFNVHAMSEVVTMSDDGGDSAFISDLDVYLEQKQQWKDMHQAFKEHDLITDNYNTAFGEPETEEDRERGYWI